MKSAIVFLAVVVAFVFAAPAQEKYSSRFDSVDVDAILNNDRLLNSYIKCLLNEGDQGCTPEGKALKGVLREAIATDCERCTERQLQILQKVLPFLRTKKANDWPLLQQKYDPEGLWAKNHPDM